MNDFSQVNITTAEYKWQDAARHATLQHWFANTLVSNIYSRKITLNVRIPIEQVFLQLREIVDPGSIKSSFAFFNSTQFCINNRNILVMSSADSPNQFVPVESDRLINYYKIEVWGEFEHVNIVANNINQLYNDRTYAKVKWHYIGSHGRDSQLIYIENSKVIKNEFYPWFKQGVDAFIDQYLASTSSVLMLYGPPGTGKTSFIKYLLTQKRLNASLTYDERILNDDGFFIDFLTDDEDDTLIVEDADVLITRCESDQNPVMSKFLNVSDGLIKIDNKKVIFTTNIGQLGSVDDALLRKGRCFAAVEFRNLTSNEAANAAQAANSVEQDWYSKQSWSLAEIFNKDHSELVTMAPKHKIGFVP